MAKQKIPAGKSEPTLAPAKPPPVMREEQPEGNAAAQEEMLAVVAGQGSGIAAAEPVPTGDPLADAGGGGEPLPFRGMLENSLGMDLGHLDVHLNQETALQGIGANAAAVGESVYFSDASPSFEVVAEEVIHTLQSGPTSGSSVSSPTDGSEVEAKTLARRAASGEAISSPRATSGAAIQRDNLPVGTRLETHEGASIVVYVGPAVNVPTRPDSAGRWHSLELNLATFKQRLTELGTLRTAVLAELDRTPATTIVRRLRDALATGTPNARAMLNMDPALQRDARITANVGFLAQVQAANTPVQVFSATVRNARQGGATGEQLLAAVRAFAATYPSQARDCLGADRLPILSGLTGAQRATAMAYMANGGTELSALARVRVAMEGRDPAAFNVAFQQISGDATVLAVIQNDATFLSEVREKLGDACFIMVQERTLLGAAADNSDLSLSEQELTAIRPLAGSTNSTLRSEFRGMWTTDSTVKSALQTYFSGVRNVLMGVTNPEAKNAKTEAARALLKTQFVQTYGTTIATGIAQGIDDPVRGECLALIRENSAHTRTAIETAREARAPSNADAAQSFPVEPTADELQRIETTLAASVEVLVSENDDWQFDDVPASRAMTRYRERVNEVIPADGGESAAERNASRRRNGAAQLLIETRFKRRTGAELVTVLADRMGSFRSRNAINHLESARSPELESEEANSYTWTAGQPLSAAERDRVLPLARTHAMRIQDAVRRLVVEDPFLHARVRSAHTALHDAVAPSHSGPVNVGPVEQLAWRRKTTAAMGVLRAEYDAMFASLVGDVHLYLQDDGMRHEVLLWLGADGSSTTGSTGTGGAAERMPGTLEGSFEADLMNSNSTLTEDQQSAFAENLTAFQDEMRRLAQRMASSLHSTITLDSTILNLSNEFKTHKATYSQLPEQSTRFTAASYLSYLEQAYMPLGGSLRSAIVDGVDEPTLSTVFTNLGLGSVSRATTQVNEEGLSSTDIDAAKDLQAPGRDLFASLAYAENLAGFGHGGASRQQNLLRAYRQALPEGVATSFLNTFYEREHSIGLGEHIGRVIPENLREGFAGIVPGLTFGPHHRNGPDAQAVADSLTADNATVPAELQFQPGEVSASFTLDVAANRCSRLHQALRSQRVVMDRADVVSVVSEGGSRPRERQIVAAMYQRLYGVSLQYAIHRFAPDEGWELSAELEHRATGNETPRPFLDEIRADVATGSDHALNQIYNKVLMASSADRQALLADPLLLGSIRSTFNHEAMDRVYRSATGEITLADLLRTRDESTEWYTLGIGNDEENARKDVKQFFRYIRRRLNPTAVSGEAAAPLEALVLARAREMLADDDTRLMLDEEFGGEELLQMEQLILRAGTQTTTDQAEQNAEGGNADAFLAQIRAMTPAERAAARQDPGFLIRVRTTLRGRQRVEGMGLLMTEGSDTHLVSLEAALTNPNNQNGVATNMIADESATTDIFTAVLAMSPNELEAMAANPVLLSRVRNGLRTRSADLALFNRLIGGAAASGATPALVGAEGLGSASTPAGQTMNDADKTRITQSLVLRHTVGIERAVRRGEDYAYAAAQSVFTEKGETTVSSSPERKENLFTTAARNQVWAHCEGAVNTATDGETEGIYYKTVHAAVLGTEDPSARRMTAGLSGMDNTEAIDGAIDSASKEFIAREWSNIGAAGTDGEDPLRLVYARYATARSDYQTAVAQAATANVDQAEQARQSVETAQTIMRARQFDFTDFRLDVAAMIAFEIGQDGRGHADRAAGSDTNILSYTVATTDSRYAELIGKLRARILSLDNATVAGVLGIPTEAVETEAGPTLDAARDEAERQEDIAALMSDDRKTRSRQQHAGDAYAMQRGQGSLADLGSADESVDLEYLRYQTDAGQAQVGDLSTGDMGLIDGNENRNINERRTAFEESVVEYRAAKAAIRDTLKWVTIAIIGAIATALTGPGGMTLLASMITAASTAGAVAVINEATMARDYEFWQEGMKDVVVQTATAAVTFGLGAGIDRAVGNSAFLQAGADKLARFRGWEEGLKAGAGESFEGAVSYITYAGGKAALNSATTDFQGAVVASIDPSQWKYGMAQSLTHTSRTFDAMRDNLGGNALTAMWTTMATTGGSVLRGAVLPPPPGDPSALDGMTPEQEQAQGRVDLYSAMRGAAQNTANLRNNRDAGIDYTVSFLVGRAKTGNWNFDSADIGAFMGGFLQKRAEHFAGQSGEGVQAQRNAMLGQQAFERLLSNFETGGVDAHGLPQADMRRNFEHFVRTQVRTGNATGDAALFNAWQRQWTTTARRLESQVSDTVQDTAEYRAWVLEDPAKSDERLRYSPDEFATARTQQLDAVSDVQNQANWSTLTPEAQRFCMTYMRSTGRIGSQGGDLGVSTPDLSTSEGLSAFRDSYAATKRAIVLHHAEEHLRSLSVARRQSLTTFIQGADPDRVLPTLDPSNPNAMATAVQEWLPSVRQRMRDAATPSDETP